MQVAKGEKKLDSPYIAGRIENGTAVMENSLTILQNSNIKLMYEPAIPKPISLYPQRIEKYIHMQEIYTQIFVALHIVAQKWKQP